MTCVLFHSHAQQKMCLQLKTAHVKVHMVLLRGLWLNAFKFVSQITYTFIAFNILIVNFSAAYVSSELSSWTRHQWIVYVIGHYVIRRIRLRAIRRIQY